MPRESPSTRATDRARPRPSRRGEQSIGSLLQVVPDLVSARIGVALDAVDFTEQVAAVGQACRRQPVASFRLGISTCPFSVQPIKNGS